MLAIAQLAWLTQGCNLLLFRHIGGGGTKHDGERYELHLCEICLFGTIAYIKQERQTQGMLDENQSCIDLR